MNRFLIPEPKLHNPNQEKKYDCSKHRLCNHIFEIFKAFNWNGVLSSILILNLQILTIIVTQFYNRKPARIPSVINI